MAETFVINQMVVHCREGLSKIVSETKIGDNDYFVVEAQNGSGEHLYVLKSKPGNIIRPIMDLEKAKKIIDYMKSIPSEFMTNTKQRRDLYKKKLSSGLVDDLAYLSKQLFLFNYYNDHGTLVKLGPTDIEMLECAERILFDEMAISFGKEIQEIKSFVLTALEECTTL